MKKSQKLFLTFGDRAIVESHIALGGLYSDLKVEKATKENEQGEHIEVMFSDNAYNKEIGRAGKNVLNLVDKSKIHQRNLAKIEVFMTLAGVRRPEAQEEEED